MSRLTWIVRTNRIDEFVVFVMEFFIAHHGLTPLTLGSSDIARLTPDQIAYLPSDDYANLVVFSDTHTFVLVSCFLLNIFQPSMELLDLLGLILIRGY
jgi:hypothetical protein